MPPQVEVSRWKPPVSLSQLQHVTTCQSSQTLGHFLYFYIFVTALCEADYTAEPDRLSESQWPPEGDPRRQEVFSALWLKWQLIFWFILKITKNILLLIKPVIPARKH